MTGAYSGRRGCVQGMTEKDGISIWTGVFRASSGTYKLSFSYINLLSISDPGCYDLVKKTTVTEQTEAKSYPKFTTVAPYTSSSQIVVK